MLYLISSICRECSVYYPIVGSRYAATGKINSLLECLQTTECHSKQRYNHFPAFKLIIIAGTLLHVLIGVYSSLLHFKMNSKTEMTLRIEMILGRDNPDCGIFGNRKGVIGGVFL